MKLCAATGCNSIIEKFKYCSDKCKVRALKKNTNPKRYTVKATCVVCGKVFKRNTNARKLTCSDDCQEQYYRQTTVPYTLCINCHKTISDTKCNAHKPDQLFCNNTCANQFENRKNHVVAKVHMELKNRLLKKQLEGLFDYLDTVIS